MNSQAPIGLVNPHAVPSIAFGEIMRTAARNRGLIAALILREVASRYRGSGLGLIWAVLNPLIMVGIYTFVFGVAFKARWAGGTGATVEFALLLFCGLIVYNVLSECLVRAPVLITSNPNYVKKVIFPLEVLPFVLVGAALFNALVSFGVWFAICSFFFRLPNATIIFVPLALVPLAVLALGVGWLLASLGVFVRDLAQVVPFVATMLLFLSPVFYPVAALPEVIRPFVYFNPLTLPIETVRQLLFLGGAINWPAWAVFCIGSTLFCYASFVWFQKTRKGFADVV
ncbi:lipopolysaccharide transport system permease protein [Chelatococcus caeni]|uniref:Transport permease protein n=1 Tax=Chelatococcus caeni TaxID=1348468 RepID=A0A840BWF3_9HYPH|nr:ABC transporter permease [Chelatococcus caeni]MBB4016042.1 lipopolysaccharide transport system permease protein [Chelatococcus caeni]